MIGNGQTMSTDCLSPTTFRKQLARSILLPLFLLVALALVFLGLIVYLLSTVAWVNHTDQVIARAHGLLKLLVDGETGMRGYLITGDPEFLEPYHAEENLGRLHGGFPKWCRTTRPRSNACGPCKQTTHSGRLTPDQ